MPGMSFITNIRAHGIPMSVWKCDRCRKLFAFVTGEKLVCPKCGGFAYPMNLDPGSDQGKSEIIIKE
jgi:rRNA maturation endonuclease Nob1